MFKECPACGSCDAELIDHIDSHTNEIRRVNRCFDCKTEFSSFVKESKTFCKGCFSCIEPCGRSEKPELSFWDKYED